MHNSVYLFRGEKIKELQKTLRGIGHTMRREAKEFRKPDGK